MCVAPASLVQLPALTKWVKFTPSTCLSYYQLYREGLGQFKISGTFEGLAQTGWQLSVAVSLPYTSTGAPYVLGVVAGIKSATKLVAVAQKYANDRKLQLQVKQAVLDAASVQHVG